MNEGKPLSGRLSERSIRSTLNVIRKKLRDPEISIKQTLQLLAYQEKLRTELKAVSSEKEKAQIKAQLAQLGPELATAPPPR